MVQRRSVRRLVALTVVLGLAVGGAVAAPVGGAGADERAGDPRIIGGTVAPPGTWRSQAAIIDRRAPSTYQGQICGGTVIDPSWVITAAHCVTDGDGDALPARQFDVLVGTHDLRSGGRRVAVQQVLVRPGWNAFMLTNDVALLQLRKPALVPRDLEVASRTDIPWSGAELDLAGWGQSDVSTDPFPAQLREVSVPAMSAAECSAALAEAREVFDPSLPAYHTSYLCTGPIGAGGRGPCYGDSGGPLTWETGGRHVLVGIVSWGLYCGSPETPAVFSRMANASIWVNQVIGRGPHWDVQDISFWLFQSYLMYEALGSPDMPVYPNIETAITQIQGMPQVQQRDLAIVRLYDAILGRPAEAWGYGYWRQRMEFDGLGITRIADIMARSTEFKATYGSLTDQQLVEQVYLNLLGRPGDPAGVAFWVGQLTAGTSRGSVVARIALSAENVAATQQAADAQVAFINVLDRAPTPAELAEWGSKPLPEVARFLARSNGYAQLYSQYNWGF